MVDLNNSLNLKKMQGSLQMIRAKQSTNGFALAMSKENQNVQNTMLSGLLTFRKKSEKGRGRMDGKKESIFARVKMGE